MDEDEARLGAKRLRELAETLARPGVGPAAGALAAAVAALAAGLGEKVGHSAGDADARLALAGLRAEALQLADEDTAVFAAFVAGGAAGDPEPIVTVPVRIAEAAFRVTSVLADLRPRVPRPLRADVGAAALLASSACRCVVEVLQANLEDHGDARLAHVVELVRQADHATGRALGEE